MKKARLALALLAAALPSVASAQTIPQEFAGQVFSNRGQCFAALVQERNERRLNGEYWSWLNAPASNHYTLYKYDCIQVDRNAWMILPARH